MKICPNKKETIKALICTSFILLLFAFFVFFDFKASADSESVFSLDWFNALFKVFFGSMSVLLAFADCLFIRILIRNKPVIEMDANGLTDNSSLISLGFIPWSDMERAYFKGAFFTIELKKPSEYLKRAGAIKRLFIKCNLKMGYGQVCISPVIISHEIEGFLRNFAAYLNIDDCDFLSDK